MTKVRTLHLRPITRKDENKEHPIKRYIRWFGYFLFVLIIFYIIKLIWFR